jgi:hypothetical protein
MRRITLTVVAILLAVPAAAAAKVGVEFTKDPATAKPGEAIPINIMIMGESKDPMAGDMAPIVGARPLATFRSESGKVVRVRGAKSNENGISAATVTFPDKGPWTGTLDVRGEVLAEGGGNMGTWTVGEALAPPVAKTVETMKPPAQTPTVGGGTSGLLIGWILLGGAAVAALAFTAMRAGLPARLRARLGGGGA